MEEKFSQSENSDKEEIDWSDIRGWFKLESICKILSVICLFVGLIISIVLAYKLGYSAEESAVSMFFGGEAVRDEGMTWGIFLAGALITAVVSTILYALGKILDKLERDDSKEKCENILNEKEETNKEYSFSDSGVWRCLQCDRINAGYTEQCVCGAEKPWKKQEL